MRVRIKPGKAGVITIAGHVDAGAEYEGEDAAMLVRIGKAVEIEPQPVAAVVDDEPDEIEYKSPSGKKITTRAMKPKKKRGRK